MSDWTFQDELRLSPVNVPRAALQYARAIAYPDLNVAAYMLALHELSESAADLIPSDLPLSAQAERLSAYLFDELGLRGNAAEYGDPRNSFLNEVLDRRVGIPISLSVVYVDVATRLGLPAYGIGLPGHFIVGVHDRDTEILLDPFHGGRQLSLRDCAELIRLSVGYEGPLEAHWFNPLDPRDILARMLNNLRSTYVQTQSWREAAAVIRLLRQTQPDAAEHLRDLGLVYYHQRALPQAAHYLNAYLQQYPDASDAQMIRDGMKGILDAWAMMN